MSCDHYDISDEEKYKLIKEMSNKIFHIVKEFESKIPPSTMAGYLIGVAKQIFCSCGMNYYFTLGMLNEMLHDNIEEIYNSYIEDKQSEEEK